MMLSKTELNRYARQMILPEIGIAGQQKLKSSKVLVVGAGGLGCPVLQYLTAAGVGTIGICDGDKVEISNLHRQILYTNDDVGKAKAIAAKAVLEKLNPNACFLVFEDFLDEKNALDVVSQFDVVVDGSDNFQTRYLVNDACVIAGKPLVFGSIFKFEGQVTVFNYKNGPTYRCLYPEMPVDAPSCSEAGVLGVLPGITGTLQANEAIKIIVGIGEVLSGKLLVFDALSMQTQFFGFEKDTSIVISDIKAEAVNCATVVPGEISIVELREKIQKGEKIQLIDLRESYEKEFEIDGAFSIPFNHVLEKFSNLDKEATTVLFCTSGKRSKIARDKLKEKYNSTEFLCLTEGSKAFN